MYFINLVNVLEKLAVPTLNGINCERPVNAVNATGIPYCYSSCIATVLLQATCLNNIMACCNKCHA